MHALSLIALLVCGCRVGAPDLSNPEEESETATESDTSSDVDASENEHAAEDVQTDTATSDDTTDNPSNNTVATATDTTTGVDTVTNDDTSNDTVATATVTATATDVDTAAPAEGFTTANNRIYHNGQEIRLFGVNWFGFETDSYCLHGLWETPWDEQMDHIVDLGFTAVRVPFCPTTLTGTTASSQSWNNPELAGMDSVELLDFMLAEMDARGLYILLDHHRPDCQAISELWYTDSYAEADWIADLVFVAERYAGLEHFLGVDLKNEPHDAATWGTGDSDTDWDGAAERAAAAILAVNDRVLIFVEGIQENATCSSYTYSHWWGGNIEPITCHPLDIPADKLVLSPHVYGPDVYAQSYFDAADFPANLPAIWDEHFGFAWDDGYSVVPGEFGGQYGGGDARDDEWQDAFIDYLIANDACHFFYWSWNANSTDTGGILQDDWVTVEAEKYANLLRLMDHCR